MNNKISGHAGSTIMERLFVIAVLAVLVVSAAARDSTNPFLQAISGPIRCAKQTQSLDCDLLEGQSVSQSVQPVWGGGWVLVLGIGAMRRRRA